MIECWKRAADLRVRGFFAFWTGSRTGVLTNLIVKTFSLVTKQIRNIPHGD
jgi:hypothetical protein